LLGPSFLGVKANTYFNREEEFYFVAFGVKASTLFSLLSDIFFDNFGVKDLSFPVKELKT